MIATPNLPPRTGDLRSSHCRRTQQPENRFAVSAFAVSGFAVFDPPSRRPRFGNANAHTLSPSRPAGSPQQPLSAPTFICVLPVRGAAPQHPRPQQWPAPWHQLPAPRKQFPALRTLFTAVPKQFHAVRKQFPALTCPFAARKRANSAANRASVQGEALAFPADEWTPRCGIATNHRRIRHPTAGNCFVGSGNCLPSLGIAAGSAIDCSATAAAFGLVAAYGRMGVQGHGRTAEGGRGDGGGRLRWR